MRFGVIGSGSWGTALVKLLTDNGHLVHWTVRSPEMASHIRKRSHNPNYLQSAHFDISLLDINTDPLNTLDACDCIVIATPSAYVSSVLKEANISDFAGKKIVSAVKGILPEGNLLMNEYLLNVFGLPLDHYFTIMGPCHAEEIATEKLSYLTFSGTTENATTEIAAFFEGPNLKTVINTDIMGVQYAGVLKNIYALGAGIAHGLDYGDNFLSVFIANAADEMACFLRMAGNTNM
ncbi:MAG: NAD(P)H-dependent glycerol-3-phosphate dehydrogenase, partial [Chitinophagaceae bacterium]